MGRQPGRNRKGSRAADEGGLNSDALPRQGARICTRVERLDRGKTRLPGNSNACECVDESILAIVAWPGDPVASAVSARLRELGAPFLSWVPGELADARLVVDKNAVRVDGHRVGSILWRVRPGTLLSARFAKEDQAFADAETAGAWIQALNLPSIFAVNRFSATAWYGGCGWPIWRALLGRAGVVVSPMFLGAHAHLASCAWLPFTFQSAFEMPDGSMMRLTGAASSAATEARSEYVVLGQMLSAHAPENLRAAAGTLMDAGVGLARVTLDEDNNVLLVDSAPHISEPSLVDLISERLAKAFYAHWRAR